MREQNTLQGRSVRLVARKTREGVARRKTEAHRLDSDQSPAPLADLPATRPPDRPIWT